jgi:formamidopyrimidine-DNA glycosylase
LFAWCVIAAHPVRLRALDLSPRETLDGPTSPAGRGRREAAGEGLWLHIHFGMSGDLAYYRDEDPPRFARLIFDFDNSAHLAYEDMRMFGVVDITLSPEEYVREHELGPDPLTIDLRRFRDLLRDRRGRIKAVLLSQDIIAGIGNLYADEALFRSSIDPRRSVDAMSDAEVKTLFTNIRNVLRETIAFKSRGGTYPARFLVQHREEGDRCPKCGGTIQRTVVAGRTTYFCARHQK